jgi:nucleoside-diphosphate-sugar epimerase
MHVLVAGATGAVGRRIVPLLLGRGDRVTGLTRSAARAAVLRAAGVDPVVVDVSDGRALTDAVRAARPDVVLHQLTDLAGQDRAANARLRTIGTRNLVDAARAAGTRRGAIAERARAGELVADESVASFVHIDDAAAAAVAAFEWPSGPVNICDDDPAAASAWVPAFCDAVHAPPPPRAATRSPGSRGANNHRARSRGWLPTVPSWREGFRAFA